MEKATKKEKTNIKKNAFVEYFISLKNRFVSFVKKIRIIDVLNFCIFCIFIAYYWVERDAASDFVGLGGVNKPAYATSLICILFQTMAAVCLVVNSRYKFSVINNAITYIIMPFAFLNIAMYYNTSLCISGKYFQYDWRSILYIVDGVLILGSCVWTTIQYKGYKFNKKIDILNMFLACLGMILFTFPVYFPQAMWGKFINESLEPYSVEHILIMAFSIAFLFIWYFIFKDKCMEVKKFAAAIYAIGTLVQFSFEFQLGQFSNLRHLPLQLCNIAMYTNVICVLFKTKRIYYFSLFYNVIGSLFATLMPDVGYIMTSPFFIVYWVNHINALCFPLILMILGIYKKPKIVNFFRSIGVFAFYIIVLDTINAYLNNFALPGQLPDYLFLNSDYILKKLGSAVKLLDYQLIFKIGNLTFMYYWLYVIVYFVVFVALTMAYWFIVELITNVCIEHLKMKSYIHEDVRNYYELVKRTKESENKEQKEDKINMIEIKDLTVKYGNYVAVDNLNLTICPGDIFAFLGHNGAGKSTTIKCLVGILQPSSGQVLIDGYDLVSQSREAKMCIGYVPDHYELYENLTGRQYINYVADIYNVPTYDRNLRIKELSEKLNLDKALDKPIKNYSHGMKQKTAIIASLIHKPKIWILDEPLTGLDPMSVYQVKEIIKDYAKQGNIVFFSSHLVDVVEKVCNKFAVINKGKLRYKDSLSNINRDGGSIEDVYIRLVAGNYAK